MKEWVQAVWELGQNVTPGSCEGATVSGINLNKCGKEKVERNNVSLKEIAYDVGFNRV